MPSLSCTFLLRVVALCYLLDTFVVSAARFPATLAVAPTGLHRHAAVETCLWSRLARCTVFGCCTGAHTETVPDEVKPYLQDHKNDKMLLASPTQNMPPVDEPPQWHDHWLNLFSEYDTDPSAETLEWGWHS